MRHPDFRWWGRAGAVVAAVAVALAASSTAQARVTATGPGGTGNPYAPSYGHPYRHGALPTRTATAKMAAYRAQHLTAAASSANLHYGGGVDGVGVTTGHPQVYLVFWGPDWGTGSTDGNGDLTFTGDPSGGAPVIQEFFKGIGRQNEEWSAVASQYCETSTGSTSCRSGDPHVGYAYGQALYGVWYDNRPISDSPSATQVAQEAVDAAGHFGNTTAATNRNAQYVILSPHNAHPDGWDGDSGWCAWHNWNGAFQVASPYGDVAFTNMPYVMDLGEDCGAGFVNGGTGALDGYTMVSGHEYAETITDQFPAGGWVDSNEDENADKCAWIAPGLTGGADNHPFATGHFAVQTTWSNEDNGCQLLRSLVAIADPGPQTLTVGQSVNISLTTSRGTAPFFFYGITVPQGLTLSGTGQLTGSLGIGRYTVKVGVRDATAFLNEDSFTITVNPPMVSVPDVTGMVPSQASTTISDSGLVPHVSSQVLCIEPGHVVGQSPGGGSRVFQGSTVRITVDSGTKSTCTIK